MAHRGPDYRTPVTTLDGDEASGENMKDLCVGVKFPHKGTSMGYDDHDDDVDDLDIRQRHEPVPNYLVQAILVTLCCCLPFGIVAIVQSSRANTHLARGEYEQAVKASEEAKKWCWFGFFFGIVANGLYLLFQMSAGMRGFR